MQKPSRILLVVDREKQPLEDVRRAVELARQCGAGLELFLCEAERAYVLDHRYEREGVDRARAECVAEALAYLRELRAAANVGSVKVSVDAECESPLYQGVVRKVLSSRADLVIKRAAAMERRGYDLPDANDWQLMRTCPATLMLARGKAWAARPRLVAAIDVSESETAGLAEGVLQSALALAGAWHASVEVVYGEPADSTSAPAHLEQLHRLCAQRGIPAESIHVLHGQPHLTLPAFLAERAYDVVILGALTHARGASALVGTLTSKVLDAVDSDFILVKPPGYRSPVGKARSRTAPACGQRA
jgi:universal stress protein E